MTRTLTLALVVACALTAAVPTRKAPPKPPIPAEYKVKLETTKGDVIIQVHREWSPLGADHFYELVTKHFYDNTAFFRAIKDFMVQVGMNGDPKFNSRWANVTIKDDPSPKMPNKPGAVTFAKTGRPDSRSTQIFINTGDNSASLDSLGFTPFGEVLSGLENVGNLYTGYGDFPPDGNGPDPDAISRDGNAYLQKSFPNLDYIKKATVIDPPPPPEPVKKAPATAAKRPAVKK